MLINVDPRDIKDDVKNKYTELVFELYVKMRNKGFNNKLLVS